ncbi:MAG TPA: preprotein translocase subunit SecA, partial [Thermoanaerobacterales bacterium]|nr:preprotein translocase subunit SecA [Thermoanaerobacterales bacterium]
AGRLGAVTIATNMAGRGTDILLGGNPEFLVMEELRRKGINPDELDEEKYNKIYRKVKDKCDEEHQRVIELGGLHIIGTERHESRRIDNQLRGRAGRQGDPGSSRFYVSLGDDLMRLFGGDNIKNIMEKVGMDDEQPVEHGLISKSIETAQTRVESRNFDIRKHVLEYDDVMNKQREVIYGQRRQVLEGEDLRGNIMSMLDEVISNIVDIYCVEGTYPEEWDLKGLLEYGEEIFLPRKYCNIEKFKNMTKDEIKKTLIDMALKLYNDKEKELGSETMREFERVVTLQVVDKKWMDHIDAMDQLKQGIGLRAYGQKDPVLEYKFEGYEMFQSMVSSIHEDIIRLLFKYRLKSKPKRKQTVKETSESKKSVENKPITSKKVGRNDPCPCNSGKKYKRCCGR